MRSESFVVAEMLQAMEQQNQLLRPQAVEVAAALSKNEYPAAREATAELHRALDTFVTTAEVLQGHVVAHDGMGELGESLDELALRARGLVLRAQLDILREELRDPIVLARSTGWFAGRFKGIADVAAYVEDRLAAIHAMWKPYRHDQPQPPGMTDTDRTNLYRTNVRVAQRALQALRDDPDLARFLDGGFAATDLIQIHLSCRQIVIILGLPIDTEPGRYRLLKSRRISPSNGNGNGNAGGA